MPTWYASTYYDGNSYASILVKTREGRPIFIKGNRDHGITHGATNPQIIASVLGLYDSARLTSPTKNNSVSTWSSIDKDVKLALEKVKAKNGKVVLVSNTIISPSTFDAINALSAATGSTAENNTFEHIQYDAQSYAGIRKANMESFGDAFIPDYDFSKAKTIVSVGADFMNSWLLPTQFAPQYIAGRNPDGEWMSKHFQFEANMSITGSNADERGMIKPSQQANVLAYILKGMGAPVNGVSTELNAQATKVADKAIKSLKTSKGASLVVAGSNNAAVQILANKLNTVLGSYGTTIDPTNSINMFKSEDEKMATFVNNVINGKGPDMVLFYGVNPVYTLPNGKAFGKALKQMKNTISFAGHADETASNCEFICPDHHALESWNDFNPKKSHYAIAQPTIRPLHNTAQAQESMMVWGGVANRGGKDSKVYYDVIAKNWDTYGFQTQTEIADLDTYWGLKVHNSVGEEMALEPVTVTFNDASLSGVAAKLPKTSVLEVEMYQKAGLGIGIQANNPWLQELPDPITKVTWDNYITMNPVEMNGKYATTFDQEHGLNLATITVDGKSVTLPVYPTPGQAIGTVGVALGYGRGANEEKIGRAAFQTKEYGGYAEDENGKLVPIGANAFAFVGNENGTMSYSSAATIKAEEGEYIIAATQIHHTVMGRHSIVRETTLDTYKSKDKEAYNPSYTLQKMDENGHHVEAPISEFDLWDAHPVEKIGHRWAMTIDLSSCYGCGSCLI
ncbi:MAG: TAT-variant-translocated molybdopterin oxidoreductase, partial [Bacteroidota bacterium]